MILPTRRERMVLRRPPVDRPTEQAPATFVCPACDVVLWDGVLYVTCPVCGLPVDWVDLSVPVFCCPTCDRMVNSVVAETPDCGPCHRPMVRIHALEAPAPAPVARAPRRRSGGWDWLIESLILALLLLGLLGPLLSLALDPRGRLLALALLAPFLLLPLTLAGTFLWQLGPVLLELRDLSHDRETRVIHGLEHATAKVLEADARLVYGGCTHRGFFELHVAADMTTERQSAVIRAAVNSAIRRVLAGETSLAYHPRCGTSLFVTVGLFALVALGGSFVGLALHLGPGVLVALGLGTIVAVAVLARPLGLLTQRLLTVSTACRAAHVLRIVRSVRGGGDRVRFDVYLRIGLLRPRMSPRPDARANP